MSLAYTTGNPNNLTGGAAANMNDIQGPFVDIKTFLTDGSGAVGDTILASPTSAVWRTVLGATGIISGLTTGVFYFSAAATIGLSGTASSGIAGLWVPATAADIAVAGKTTRFRVRVALLTNNTAPGINITWGLYGIASNVGGSGLITPTLGALVTGSGAAAVAPNGQGAFVATGASFDLAAVTANGATAFVIGVTGSASQAATSVIACQAFLEMRHT